MWGRRAAAAGIGWNRAARSRMAMETNVEIFQRLLEAFNREGVEGVLAVLRRGRRGL